MLPFNIEFCSYPTALEMVASGSVNVKPLITHTYTLEESLKAFERAKTGEGGAIKVSCHLDNRCTLQYELKWRN